MRILIFLFLASFAGADVPEPDATRAVSYVTEGLNALVEINDTQAGILLDHGLAELREFQKTTGRSRRERLGILRLGKVSGLDAFEKNFMVGREGFLLQMEAGNVSPADLEQWTSKRLSSGRVLAAIETARLLSEEERARSILHSQTHLLDQTPELFRQVHRRYRRFRY